MNPSHPLIFVELEVVALMCLRSLLINGGDHRHVDAYRAELVATAAFEYAEAWCRIRDQRRPKATSAEGGGA